MNEKATELFNWLDNNKIEYELNPKGVYVYVEDLVPWTKYDYSGEVLEGLPNPSRFLCYQTSPYYTRELNVLVHIDDAVILLKEHNIIKNIPNFL